MNKPPAFQFYPKDWLDFKVTRMTYEAQGIYLRILCHMWTDSRDQYSILNDDKAIAGALGISIRKWQGVKKEIQYDGDPLLRQRGKKLISKRLKKEAEKLQNYHRSQREKGKKSAESRYLRGATVKPRSNHGSTGEATTVQPEGNSSSSSSSSSTKKNKKKEEYTVLFKTFWDSWPSDRRDAKKQCEIKFLALCKKGRLKDFQKACANYAAFLDYQKNINNFNQTPKLSGTFMNNWEEWIEKEIDGARSYD